MTSSKLGPRRTELLKAWGEYAASNPEGEYHDFTAEDRNERVKQHLDAFLSDPTNDAFEALWTSDVLRDSVIGGPSLVRNSWPGSIDDLASLFKTMQSANEYDEAWERDFTVPMPLWELYGHMQPEERPILNSPVFTGLDSLGFAKPSTYHDRAGYVEFVEVYESIVGHATAGTDHEVPLSIEIEQFLSAVGTEDREKLRAVLPLPQK